MQCDRAPADDVLDGFLAFCVRAILEGREPPPWPEELDLDLRSVTERITFHGIALILADSGQSLIGWPEKVATSLQTEARLQAIWEVDHKAAIARLIEALHEAGFDAVVIKGTALAYSLYDDAAQRRRGDTDLLIEDAPRKKVRRILKACGFEPTAERHFLQEGWTRRSASGFNHQLDLHWAVSSSPTVSEAFEADHPRNRLQSLASLSPHARSPGPIDSFILSCANRISHAGFGYFVENRRMFDGNRLIWAVDLHLLAAGFSQDDWRELARIGAACGAARTVSSALGFARDALGTVVPRAVTESLENCEPERDAIHHYYAESTPSERMAQDMTASRTVAAKAGVLSRHLLPTRDFMNRRYPGSARWPLAALQARRLLDAGVRMLLGGKR